LSGTPLSLRPTKRQHEPCVRAVQDHIKSLFEKANVSSRQELVARIFFNDYLPHIAAGTPITSTGGFAATV
jgi:hypothetical protein